MSYFSVVMHKPEKANIQENIRNFQTNNTNYMQKTQKERYLNIIQKWLNYKKEKINYVYSFMKVNQFIRNFIKKFKEKKLSNIRNNNNKNQERFIPSKMTKYNVQNIIFPDFFIDHDSSENQYKSIGMDAQSIEQKIFKMSINKEIDIRKINSL